MSSETVEYAVHAYYIYIHMVFHTIFSTSIDLSLQVLER
jgi:hypothetical protein